MVPSLATAIPCGSAKRALPAGEERASGRLPGRQSSAGSPAGIFVTPGRACRRAVLSTLLPAHLLRIARGHCGEKTNEFQNVVPEPGWQAAILAALVVLASARFSKRLG